LQNAAGFLQQKVNDRIETRYVPVFSSCSIKGVKNAAAVAQILQAKFCRPNDGWGRTTPWKTTNLTQWTPFLGTHPRKGSAFFAFG
jgi:hypothetical protein